MGIAFQSSVLFVEDAAASRQFYEVLLGQEVLMDHGPNVAFVGGFAIWQTDHAHQITFGESPAELGQGSCELYFETENLDAAWARLSESDVKVVHPLREQPWGQRVFRLYDPDGYIVELGEPMPVVVQRFLSEGFSTEEVAERTSMPLGVVQQISGSGA
jgi:uncharacterized glyoxalase superfamily protein PhnB